jgi:hypothetical protein
MGGFGRASLLMAAVLLSAAGMVSADSPEAALEDQGDIAMLNLMLSKRSFLQRSSREQTQELAARIPEERRSQLYHAYREDKAVLGAGVNLFIPTLGSLIQYDWMGAVTEAALIAAAYGAFMFLMFDGEPYLEDVALGFVVGWASFSVIRPFWWSSVWNRRLSRALLMPSPQRAPTARALEPAPVPMRTSWSVPVSLLRIEY